MSWKTVKIGSFLKERVGRYKPSQANAMGLKRVEKIDFSGTYHLVDKPTNTDMIVVKKGDLLISGINAEKGAVTIYRDEEDALATIHYSSYEFDETKIYIDYFKWFLISDAFKNLLRASAGSGIKTELKAKHLLPLEVNLPPLVEQMEIVESINSRQAKLKTIETEVDQQQTYLQLLRQIILQEAVQGKLTKQDPTDEPATELLKRIKAEKEKLIKAGKLKKEKELPPIAEDEIPFELPKGWVWCRLGKVIDCERGRFSIRPRNDPRYYNGPYPFIQIGDLHEDGGLINEHQQTLNEKGLKVSKMFPKGTIAIAIVGGTIGNTGVLAYDMCFPDSLIGIIPTDYYSSDYLGYFLRSKKAEFRKISYAGGGQPNIKVPTITNSLFPLPPLAEQQRVVAKVHHLQQQISQLETQVQQSRQFVQHLLQSVLKEAFEKKGSVYEMEEVN